MSWVVEWGGTLTAVITKDHSSRLPQHHSPIWMKFGDRARFFSSSLVLPPTFQFFSLETGERDEDGDRSWPASSLWHHRLASPVDCHTRLIHPISESQRTTMAVIMNGRDIASGGVVDASGQPPTSSGYTMSVGSSSR